MKNLDITALSKAACRADDWRGVAFALFVGGGFLSAAGIAEHIRDGLAMMPVAFLCILWLNMRLAWAKHRHAVDMLAVAQKLAAMGGDDETESGFPWTQAWELGVQTSTAPKMAVPCGAGKSGIIKKMLEDEGYVLAYKEDGLEGYVKPKQDECVECVKHVLKNGFLVQFTGKLHSCPDGGSQFMLKNSQWCPRCGKRMPIAEGS